MKLIFSTLFIFIFVHNLSAQNYVSNFKSSNTKGFHKIELSPEIRSLTKNNVNHIRIKDSKNNEIPFVLFQANADEIQFKEFKILSKTEIPNVSSSVILENENLNKIDELIVEIANTSIQKKYSISGSNDSKSWYGLVNNQTIENLSNSSGTSIQHVFTFPLNNYKFLKFDFVDKNSLAINVLNAKIKLPSVEKEDKIVLKNFDQKISHDKKLKRTFIEVTFSKPQVINSIGFKIKEPSFYQRNAKIYIKKENLKRGEVVHQNQVSNFELSSKGSNRFNLSNLFSEKFTIEIENADNQVLEIEQLYFFQDKQFIISDLKPNENYMFYINPSFSIPNYDLSKQDYTLTNEIPTIEIKDIKEVVNKKETQETIGFLKTKNFMWICIVLAIIILGYFSFTLLKDLDRKK